MKIVENGKMRTKKIDGGIVTYQDGQGVKDAIFEKLLTWFCRHKAFDGYGIMQCDAPNLDAPNVLCDIADDIFEFDVVWDEDDL